VGGDLRRESLAASAMVENETPSRSRGSKALLVAPLRTFLRATSGFRESVRRIVAHASLAADMTNRLPSSVVVLGRSHVYGSGAIQFGEAVLLYPDLHLETQEPASIRIGDGVVISRGVHIVAMAGIEIGAGSMIGEYTSIRDANHQRSAGVPIRDAGHDATAIRIGREVWIGRGAAILAGVTIGDYATIGAGAVVTRDVGENEVVGGVPARPLRRSVS
jgi:acetyltransferase-like isoleucine patch superfamily enzyme